MRYSLNLNYPGPKNILITIIKNDTLIKKGENIMKKIILIIFVSLMFANIGFAEMRVIEKKRLNPEKGSYYNMVTICIDGYKFVISEHHEGHAVSIVQFYEGPDLPARC